MTATTTSNTPITSRSLNQQLLEAAKNGDNEEVCRLVLLDEHDDHHEGGGIVDVNTKDKRGYTVLHYCSNRTENRPDDGDTVRLILDRGAMVEARNHEGCTPLHYASKNGLVDTVSALLEFGGAHANSKNVFEWTPLMYCAEYNQAKVACLLLAKGASVHTKNRAGCTPLHYASIAGHVSIIYLLLGMGADVHAKRKADGKTPLELAKNEETARILNGGSLSLQAAIKSPVSSLQAALQKPKQAHQQQMGGSSLQTALHHQQQQQQQQEQQQPQGGEGGSSLQTALRQTQQQQQTAAASIVTAATSKSSGSAHSGNGINMMVDTRMDALVEKQEHLTASLENQVNRLEMLLVSNNYMNNAQNEKDDTTITMLDHDDLQQENFKSTAAVAAPVQTITIQSPSKYGMAHQAKNKAPQQQQDITSKVPGSGRYSMTIGSKTKQQQQQPKQSNDDNTSNGDSKNRHLYRTVLVPIGTNSDGGTTTEHNNTSNANSPNTRTTTSSPRITTTTTTRQHLSDFEIPPKTPPTAKQQTRAKLSDSKKQDYRKPSGTPGSSNKYSHTPPPPPPPPPPPLDEQSQKSSNSTRVQRSGLMERMKMYEKDATGFLRRNDGADGQQQPQHNNNNDKKQNKSRMTNQY